LNYETRWMTREQLVAATYDAAEALNALKQAYGRIDQARGQKVGQRIARARDLEKRLDAVEHGEELDPEAFQALQGEIDEFSISTVCDKRELFWRRHLVNFRLWEVLRVVLAYFVQR